MSAVVTLIAAFDSLWCLRCGGDEAAPAKAAAAYLMAVNAVVAHASQQAIR